ncbi:MAG TPA: EI24 domain-containing protein [Acetobacteraceae bacterium]|nr:EI24 domain-containing protein [Acetobacteraceae bacterium]
MPAALLLAFGQMGDPAFLRPLIKGVLGALLALAALAWGTTELAAWLAAGRAGWVSAVAQAIGAGAGLLLAWWLFLPVSVAIASLFVAEVAMAVERRHYPDLPPARGASTAAQIRWGIRFGAIMLLVQLLLLPLLLVPVAGFTIALVISAWMLGIGVFESTAQLRLGIADAHAARRARRFSVWLLGVALALMGLVPALNLLVPVLGTAAAVHLLHRSAGGRGNGLRG